MRKLPSVNTKGQSRYVKMTIPVTFGAHLEHLRPSPDPRETRVKDRHEVSGIGATLAV